MSGIEVGVAFRDGRVAPAGYNEASQSFQREVQPNLGFLIRVPKTTWNQITWSCRNGCWVLGPKSE